MEQKIREATGYTCDSIHGVTEVDLADASGMSFEEAVEELVDEEQILALQDKLAELQETVNEFLMNANLMMEEKLTPEHLIEIKNAVVQLEKETLQLGMTVTKEGRK